MRDIDSFLNEVRHNVSAIQGNQASAPQASAPAPAPQASAPAPAPQASAPAPAPQASAPAPSRPAHWQPGDALNDVQEYLQMKGKPLSLIALAADVPPPEEIAKSYDHAPAPQASAPQASAPVSRALSDDLEDDDHASAPQASAPVSSGRKCRICGETGHNARTCKSGAGSPVSDKQDDDLGDPLDALLNQSLASQSAPAPVAPVARASAPVARASAPQTLSHGGAPAPAPAYVNNVINTLYIDCLPLNKDFVTLDAMFAQVASEISDQGIAHFKLAEYGKGAGIVAALVAQKLKEYEGRLFNVIVDSQSLYAQACLDVLKQNAGAIVKGIR